MPFGVEFSAESARDFELIFDHLLENYIGFGEDPEEALKRAAHRIMGIRRAADGWRHFPSVARRATMFCLASDISPLTASIYWFDVDEAAQKVRILAIFLGGQDRVRHMLVRLLREDEKG